MKIVQVVLDADRATCSVDWKETGVEIASTYTLTLFRDDGTNHANLLSCGALTVDIAVFGSLSGYGDRVRDESLEPRKFNMHLGQREHDDRNSSNAKLSALSLKTTYYCTLIVNCPVNMMVVSAGDDELLILHVVECCSSYPLCEPETVMPMRPF